MPVWHFACPHMGHSLCFCGRKGPHADLTAQGRTHRCSHDVAPARPRGVGRHAVCTRVRGLHTRSWIWSWAAWPGRRPEEGGGRRAGEDAEASSGTSGDAHSSVQGASVSSAGRVLPPCPPPPSVSQLLQRQAAARTPSTEPGALPAHRCGRASSEGGRGALSPHPGTLTPGCLPLALPRPPQEARGTVTVEPHYLLPDCAPERVSWLWQRPGPGSCVCP